MTQETNTELPADLVELGDDTHARLLAAMDTIGYIQKDGRNTFGSGYRYLSERAVKEAVQDAIVKAGVMPLSVRFDVLEDVVREVPIGKRVHNLIKLRATIRFPGGYEFEGLGSSADVTDKAMMQAQTVAMREAWKNVFVIPSGDDAEEKSPEKEKSPTQEAPEAPQARPSARRAQRPAEGQPVDPPPATQEQIDSIKDAAKAAGIALPAVSALCMDRYKVKGNGLNTSEAVDFLGHLRSLVKG